MARLFASVFQADVNHAATTVNHPQIIVFNCPHTAI